jgi:hypothetical protein
MRRVPSLIGVLSLLVKIDPLVELVVGDLRLTVVLSVDWDIVSSIKSMTVWDEFVGLSEVVVSKVLEFLDFRMVW